MGPQTAYCGHAICISKRPQSVYCSWDKWWGDQPNHETPSQLSKSAQLSALTMSNFYEGLWCLDDLTSTQSRLYSNTTASQSDILPWGSLLNCLFNQLWAQQLAQGGEAALTMSKKTADHAQKVTQAFEFMKLMSHICLIFFFSLWEKCKVLRHYNQTDANHILKPFLRLFSQSL